MLAFFRRFLKDFIVFFLIYKILFKNEGHISWIRSIKVVSKDKLVTGSEDKTIKIWNYKTGQLLSTLEGKLY